MLPHPMTNFKIQRFYQDELKFNDGYSRNNLSNIKDGTYIINLDEYELIGTHWIAWYVNSENATNFDSFGVEHTKRNLKIHKKLKYVIVA